MRKIVEEIIIDAAEVTHYSTNKTLDVIEPLIASLWATARDPIVFRFALELAILSLILLL